MGVYSFLLFGGGGGTKKMIGTLHCINLLLDMCCVHFHKDFYCVLLKQHSHASWVDWNIKHISQKKLLLAQ